MDRAKGTGVTERAGGLRVNAVTGGLHPLLDIALKNRRRGGKGKRRRGLGIYYVGPVGTVGR